MASDLTALPTPEKEKLLRDARNAFNFRRRIEIHGLPIGIPEEVCSLALNRISLFLKNMKLEKEKIMFLW